jgi:hypothetical protein
MKSILIIAAFSTIFINSCKSQTGAGTVKCGGVSLSETSLNSEQKETLQSYVNTYYNPPKKIEQLCFTDRGIEKHDGKSIGLYEANTLIQHLPSMFILKGMDGNIEIISGNDIHASDATVEAFLKRNESYLTPKTRNKIRENLNRYAKGKLK